MEGEDYWHFAEDFNHQLLEDDCALLQSLLDDCLKIEVGDELFEKIEKIRTLSHCASQLHHKGDEDAANTLAEKLVDDLMTMPIDEAIPLTRACGHYLNLTGIAETHHRESKTGRSLDEVFEQLISQGATMDELYTSFCRQKVEIVLTAHPTQVNRRTLQYKHMRIAGLLTQNDRKDLTREERDAVIADMVREITALWQTDELRRRKPTPLDEARGGLHIVEQSLWAAIPTYLRRVNAAVKKHTGRELPIDAAPIVFGSWMGGDRDGNPTVTAKVTHSVACLARWMAADLYLREVEALRFELSMSHANEEVWRWARECQVNAQDDASHSARPSNNNATTPAIPLRQLSSNASFTASATGSNEAAAARAAQHDEHPETNLPSVPHIGPFVNVGGSQQEVGSPPSQIVWTPPSKSPSDASPHREGENGHNDSRHHRVNFRVSPASSPCASQEVQEADVLFEDDPSGSGKKEKEGLPSLPEREPSAAGMPLGALGTAPSETVAFNRQPSWAIPRTDSKGNVLNVAAMKRRGLRAASFHKTSVDALLHPRYAGATPYRIVLGEVRQRLVSTRRRMEAILAGVKPEDDEEWYESQVQLAEPLLAIYWSLWETGGGIIADGRLLDLIRRLFCFGLSLMKMDLRQEASRYLEMGSYREWEEETRLAFLERELQSKRPLIPPSMPMSSSVKEVVDTFRAAAGVGSAGLGAYVISMATRASDVLAVELLKREACITVAGDAGMDAHLKGVVHQRVVPLFETLSDLEQAGSTMRQLFSVQWYRTYLREAHGDHQEVMLGYSDSGKDAGRIAAAWALYKCQEQLVEVCKEHGISLTLFHGRGGSIGRGGGPMYLAIQSQPPGSVQGSLRITEQGEMVNQKFGTPAVGVRQLEVYTTAVAVATNKPPKLPRDAHWRSLMDDLSRISCEDYRSIVYKHPHFISYFRNATPEEELANLNIGSRPARRKQGGGLETLRAIPWIFAWTQTRLVLPAWLGIGAALSALFDQGYKGELRLMYEHWPFFQSTIDLVEMILAKADVRIAALYDDLLVTAPEEKRLGLLLRQKFQQTVDAVLEVTGHTKLCQNNATLRRLIETRNPHIDPINILQVEILRRLRQDPTNAGLRDALLISINGISAGMRNTG